MSVESVQYKIDVLRDESNIVQRHIDILESHGEQSDVLEKQKERIQQKLRLFQTLILLSHVQYHGEEKD